MWYITRRYLSLLVWHWGPVLAAMLMMFVASAQPKYGPPPGASPFTIYFSGVLPVFPGLWEFLIKKSAHMIAYGVLALLLARALVAWGVTARRAAILAVLLALAYALLDEAHQALVPGRHASLTDIGLDAAGASLFMMVGHSIRRKQPLP
ncbi:MAG: VanZ family protein [Anaerolineae bacterium]|nr:VanZ family protein [Anaerolineae bacterium]